VREALTIYMRHREKEAEEEYRFGCLMYALMRPHFKGVKLPEVPEELEERMRGNT
jgi:hypothetical protein